MNPRSTSVSSTDIAEKTSSMFRLQSRKKGKPIPGRDGSCPDAVRTLNITAHTAVVNQFAVSNTIPELLAYDRNRAATNPFSYGNFLSVPPSAATFQIVDVNMLPHLNILRGTTYDFPVFDDIFTLPNV